MSEENIDIWQEYCEKGEKQIRGTLNGYRDLQNEIYNYACETGILNNPVLTGPQLDVEVILARMMRLSMNFLFVWGLIWIL